jgi:LPXTG-site transpeptidase (sortase) family protein
MRRIGILIILVLFGMSVWKGSDRYQIDLSEPMTSQTNPQVVEITPAEEIEGSSAPRLVEEASPQAEQPVQPDLLVEPVVEESSATELKHQQDLASTGRSTKSFEQVVIPTLKINTSLVSMPYSDVSWDLSTLGQDIALLANIPNQTSLNNIVLAGHVTVRDGSNGPFRYLWKLNPGDQILLKDKDNTYTYIVREQVLVYPDDTSVLADSPNPQLTLITCTTWDEETLSYLRRRVIIADLVRVESRQVLMD